MRARSVTALVAIVSCGAPSRQPVASPGSAPGVLQQARAHGAEPVIDSMFRDPAFGDLVDNGISSGDSVWLLVARTLRPASDAGISEELDMSLGAALPRNPVGVLRLLADSSTHFSLEGVCDGEILLDDVDTLRADSVNSAHRRAARAALRRVSAPELLARRDSCLAQLGTSG